MTDSKQINVRLSAYTRQQLDTLVAQTGMTTTTLISMAIDQLARAELKPPKKSK